MADEFSFDVVSKVDPQAVDDAVNAANKEISVRFDFRGSISRLDFDKGKDLVTLISDDEGKMKSVVDIFQTRLVKRAVDLKAVEWGKIEASLGGKVRQTAQIKQGIETEKAKAIVARIKELKEKVTPSIRADQVRVTARSKDALQTVITFLKGQDFGQPLQFINYR